ncbi:MAG: hypothetical protein V7655_06555 [Aequorivita antarctica]
MNKKTTQKIAIQILTDAVIFERTLTGMNEIANVINPDEGQIWKASEHYTGFSNAYAVLGYGEGAKDETITDEFHSIFFGHFNNDKDTTQSQRKDAQQLAQCIFTDWLNIEKRYDLINIPFSSN